MNTTKNMMKQMEPTMQEINGNTFYIYPFPAFKSAKLSGEIIALFTPAVTALMAASKNKGNGFMDMDLEEAAPYMTGAFSTLSGDKMENLLRQLLLSGNIGVIPEGGTQAQWLTEELSNEVFCQNTQDMFVLAFHVIKVNYAGFFGNFGNLSGNVKEALATMSFPGTEPLMKGNSAN